MLVKSIYSWLPMFKTSKKIFAHIDCDSFFASCEVFRNPSLRGKMVCVGHDIIIAATYNVKDLGIWVGTPVWEAQKILKWHGVFLPVDMKLYGQMSKKLMNFLKEYTQNVEVFSIDEAFVEITWMDEIYGVEYEEVAKILQKKILQEVGVPVSIGVSNTRIKAKIFSKINKPFWIYAPLDTEVENAKFQDMYFWKIPFIGRGYQERLRRKIKTVYDFKRLGYHYLAKHLGKNGTTLRLELSGVNAMTFRAKEWVKWLSRTRSFNHSKTADKEFLWGQLQMNLHRIFEELIIREYEARYVKIYLKTREMLKFSSEKVLESHTMDRNIFAKTMREMFESIFDDTHIYRKTGVIVWDFRPYDPKQLTLFEAENQNFYKKKHIEESLQKLNKKYGRFTVKIGV